MPPGQESLAIVVDYKSTTLRTNPSISVALKVRLDHIYQKRGFPIPLGTPYLTTTLRRDIGQSDDREPAGPAHFFLQRHLALPGSSHKR